MVSCWANAF